MSSVRKDLKKKRNQEVLLRQVRQQALIQALM